MLNLTPKHPLNEKWNLKLKPGNRQVGPLMREETLKIFLSIHLAVFVKSTSQTLNERGNVENLSKYLLGSVREVDKSDPQGV